MWACREECFVVAQTLEASVVRLSTHRKNPADFLSDDASSQAVFHLA